MYGGLFPDLDDGKISPFGMGRRIPFHENDALRKDLTSKGGIMTEGVKKWPEEVNPSKFEVGSSGKTGGSISWAFVLLMEHGEIYPHRRVPRRSRAGG